MNKQLARCPKCLEMFYAPSGHDPLKFHLPYCDDKLTVRPWGGNVSVGGWEVISTGGDSSGNCIAYSRSGSPDIYLPSIGGHEIVLTEEQAEELAESLRRLMRVNHA